MWSLIGFRKPFENSWLHVADWNICWLQVADWNIHPQLSLYRSVDRVSSQNCISRISNLTKKIVLDIIIIMDNRYDDCKYFNSLIVNILDIINKQMRCYKYKYLYSLLAGTDVIWERWMWEKKHSSSVLQSNRKYFWKKGKFE